MASIEDIYNFVQIDDMHATAGQPTKDEYSAIAAAGYTVVINLAAEESTNYDPQEAKRVSALGLEYLHIPVIWTNPTSADYDQYVQTMKTHADAHRFVHCIANMRVSAFTYLYRIIEEGVAEADARATMHRIWKPGETHPVWDTFIREQLVRHGY